MWRFVVHVPGCSNLAWYLPDDWQTSNLMFRVGRNSFEGFRSDFNGDEFVTHTLGIEALLAGVEGFEEGRDFSSGLSVGGVGTITFNMNLFH